MIKQRAIAEYLRQVAQWRRGRAEEYDYERDPRHLQSAAGLEELANYVLDLPDDDRRLQRLVRFAFSGEVFTPSQRIQHAVARFRFHQSEASLDGFLDHLVELAIADHEEAGRFAGRLPEGEQDPFTRW